MWSQNVSTTNVVYNVAQQSKSSVLFTFLAFRRLYCKAKHWRIHIPECLRGSYYCTIDGIFMMPEGIETLQSVTFIIWVESTAAQQLDYVLLRRNGSQTRTFIQFPTLPFLHSGNSYLTHRIFTRIFNDLSIYNVYFQTVACIKILTILSYFSYKGYYSVGLL